MAQKQKASKVVNMAQNLFRFGSKVVSTVQLVWREVVRGLVITYIFFTGLSIAGVRRWLKVTGVAVGAFSVFLVQNTVIIIKNTVFLLFNLFTWGWWKILDMATTVGGLLGCGSRLVYGWSSRVWWGGVVILALGLAVGVVWFFTHGGVAYAVYFLQPLILGYTACFIVSAFKLLFRGYRVSVAGASPLTPYWEGVTSPADTKLFLHSYAIGQLRRYFLPWCPWFLEEIILCSVAQPRQLFSMLPWVALIKPVPVVPVVAGVMPEVALRQSSSSNVYTGPNGDLPEGARKLREAEQAALLAETAETAVTRYAQYGATVAHNQAYFVGIGGSDQATQYRALRKQLVNLPSAWIPGSTVNVLDAVLPHNIDEALSGLPFQLQEVRHTGEFPTVLPDHAVFSQHADVVLADGRAFQLKTMEGVHRNNLPWTKSDLLTFLAGKYPHGLGGRLIVAFMLRQGPIIPDAEVWRTIEAAGRTGRVVQLNSTLGEKSTWVCEFNYTDFSGCDIAHTRDEIAAKLDEMLVKPERYLGLKRRAVDLVLPDILTEKDILVNVAEMELAKQLLASNKGLPKDINRRFCEGRIRQFLPLSFLDKDKPGEDQTP